MKNALAMIECASLPTALEAANTMLKTSHMKLIGYEKTGGGHVTVLLYGTTETMQHAIEKGIQSAENVGEILSLNIISDPHPALMRAPGLDVTTHYTQKQEHSNEA